MKSNVTMDGIVPPLTWRQTLGTWAGVIIALGLVAALPVTLCMRIAALRRQLNDSQAELMQLRQQTVAKSLFLELTETQKQVRELRQAEADRRRAEAVRDILK